MITRPAPVITDRTDPRYRAALTRRCEICRAKPGTDCQNSIRPGETLPGRIVHIERMSNAEMA